MKQFLLTPSQIGNDLVPIKYGYGGEPTMADPDAGAIALSAGTGALSGAATGFSVGGPIGAVAGAVIGLVGGALGGSAEDKAKREAAYAQQMQVYSAASQSEENRTKSIQQNTTFNSEGSGYYALGGTIDESDQIPAPNNNQRSPINYNAMLSAENEALDRTDIMRQVVDDEFYEYIKLSEGIHAAEGSDDTTIIARKNTAGDDTDKYKYIGYGIQLNPRNIDTINNTLGTKYTPEDFEKGVPKADLLRANREIAYNYYRDVESEWNGLMDTDFKDLPIMFQRIALDVKYEVGNIRSYPKMRKHMQDGNIEGVIAEMMTSTGGKETQGRYNNKLNYIVNPALKRFDAQYEDPNYNTVVYKPDMFTKKYTSTKPNKSVEESTAPKPKAKTRRLATLRETSDYLTKLIPNK